MNTRIVLLFLGIASISIGFVQAAPSSGPAGENSKGMFGTYFDNMANNPCTGNDILVGFSNTADANFLKTSCLSIGSKLASFLGGYGVAPTGQAIIGFDTTTGAPKYGTVGQTATGWSISGNTGTVAGTNFIGTNDNQDLIIKTQGSEVARFTTGGNIVGLGYSLRMNAGSSMAIGSEAGWDMRGTSNIAVGGYQAGYNMGGSRNSALGGVGPGNTMVGMYNTAAGGWGAGANMAGSMNSAFGGMTPGISMDGTYNLGIGGLGAGWLMTGSLNGAFGGNLSGYRMNGIHNTAVGGYQAGVSMQGDMNTAIGGYFVGNAMVGTGNTAIGGYSATITNNSVQYSVVIGSGARSLQDGAIILGGGGANVGVGLSNPTEKLDVNGNIKAAAFLYSSDRRLKDNIHSLSNVDEKLSLLSGVGFEWKDTGRSDIGFIAQDVEKIIPELVHTGKDDMKSIEYGNITALLVEGYKYQKARADDLEKRIEKIEQLSK